jgi:uncharacterized protein
MPEDDRLTVLGRASGELAPDRIEWMLIVRETGDDPQAAFARCAERLAALAASLALADVTTGAVTVAAEYDRENRRPTGQNTASAALTAAAPLELGGEVAAAAMEGGADELRGPRTRTPDPTETVDALLAEAVRRARRRAEKMADAAGRRLGRVISIEDHRSHYDSEWDREAELMSRQQSGGGERPPVIPHPQPLSVAVVVVFELTD